jgi:hypothetical protein
MPIFPRAAFFEALSLSTSIYRYYVLTTRQRCLQEEARGKSDSPQPSLPNWLSVLSSNSSNGDIVADLFGGSGSTLIDVNGMARVYWRTGRLRSGREEELLRLSAAVQHPC